MIIRFLRICEAEEAMLHCVECEQKLCVRLHKQGARASHRRSPLNVRALLNATICNTVTDTCTRLSVPTFECEKDQSARCKFCAR